MSLFELEPRVASITKPAVGMPSTVPKFHCGPRLPLPNRWPRLLAPPLVHCVSPLASFTRRTLYWLLYSTYQKVTATVWPGHAVPL